MKILITGATGLVGKKLCTRLRENSNHELRLLTRSPNRYKSNEKIKYFKWDLESEYIDLDALESIDIIIHLAGESVAEGRWSKSKKERILNSRIGSTKLLLKKLEEAAVKPQKFITASAIGIYGDTGESEVDESSSFGSDFLAEVCQQWENELFKEESINSYALRIGLVLASEGGALSKMLPAFKAGLGGKLGSGRQYMSWVHIEDLISMLSYLVENNPDQKIFNAVSPSPVTNQEFTKTLGEVLKRPTVLPAPAMALKVLLGEMSQILLTGQKVRPSSFLESKFQYKFKDLKSALLDLLI